MSKDLLVLADEYAAATATFARSLALKASADSMSPIARDAGDKRAALAEALAALDTAQPAPDCRTCAHSFYRGKGSFGCKSYSFCTNGDQYQPALKVVLWRTE